MRKSLKAKLIALFLLLSLIPLISVGFLSYRASMENIREEVLSGSTLFLEQTKENLNSFFAERVRDGEFITNAADIRNSMSFLRMSNWDIENPMWESRLRVLTNFAHSIMEHFQYVSVIVVDPQGMIVYSDQEEEIGTVVMDEPHIERGLTEGVGWSEPFHCQELQENCMVLVKSITEREEGDLGAIAMSFSLDHLEHIIHAGVANLGDTGDAYLLNEEGLLITNTRRGPYQEGAALQETLTSEDVELLLPAIAEGDLDFFAQEEFMDFLGEPVLGSKSVALLGDVPVGVVVKVDQDEIFAGARTLQNLIFGILLGATVLIIIISYYVSSSITKPLLGIMEMMGKAQNRDLTVEYRGKGRDEIGRLGQSFTKMMAGLRESMQGVQESAGTVDAAAGRISQASGAIKEGNQNQASAVHQLLASIEEMNASIQESSDQIQETASYSERVVKSSQGISTIIHDISAKIQGAEKEIQEVSRSIGEMNRGIEESEKETQQVEKDVQAAVDVTQGGQEQVHTAVAEMERIRETVQELAGVIRALGDSAGRIGEIVEVIDDIAEQTNLLALNAAIEAARAGENGKGFAVVAGAIGDLAEKSQEATQDIGKLIKNIQGEVQNAVDTSESGSRRVEEGAGLVQKAGTAFQEIQGAVQKVTERIDVIGKHISKEASESRQIGEAIQNINTFMQELSHSTESQITETETMLGDIEKISDILRDVATAMEEQTASSLDIGKTLQEVNSITGESARRGEEIAQAGNNVKDLAQSLMDLVKKFRIE